MKKTWPAKFILSGLMFSILGVAQSSYASPCTDLIDIRLLFPKAKLEGATRLRTQIETEYDNRLTLVDEAMKKLAAQRLTVQLLAQRQEGLDLSAKEQEGLLRKLSKAIKKSKRKKRSARELKRQRKNINATLIDLQQGAFQAKNALYSAQFDLMSLDREVYFANVELEEQATLLAEALAQEQEHILEISQLEQERAACPSE